MATNTLQQNLVPSEPQLIDLLNLFKKGILLDFNSHHIGTIQSFDATKQVASVTINYVMTNFRFDDVSSVYESYTQSYPVIAQAPVIVLGGGNTALTFPIAVGDECLVLFNDRDLDNWFAGSSNSANATLRLHSFSDAVILVGLRSLPNVIMNYDTMRTSLRGSKDGKTAVSVGPTLIKIANSSYTLNGLLQNLCTDVQNLISALTMNAATFIAATGAPGAPSPLNPAIAASLTMVSTSLSNVATQLGGLLE